MSVNKYDHTTGELVTLANGSRVWIGTKANHNAAKQAGTLPTDCLICITDDDDEFKTDQVIEDSQMVITSGGVYDALHGEVLADINNLNVADNTDYKVSDFTLDSLSDYDHIVLGIMTSDGLYWKYVIVPIKIADGIRIDFNQMYGGGMISGTWYYLGLVGRLDSSGLYVRYQLTNYSNRHINRVKVIGYK